MKKNFILLKAFYKKIMVPAVFLLIVIFIAELLFAYLIGTYRYYTLTDKLFSDVMQDESSLYVMKFTLEGSFEELIPELQKMSPVKDIYINRISLSDGTSYKNTNIKIMFINTEMFRDYELLQAKTFFSETGMAGGVPQGIAAGDFIKPSASARNIQIDFNGMPTTINLLGSITAPYYVPAFNNAGTAVSSYDIIQSGPDTIFMKDTPEVRDFFKEKGLISRYAGLGFILTFQECTEEEKKPVYDLLEEWDLFYSNTETILKNSKEVTAYTLELMMPLPIYLTILSTILMWCFSLMFLHKKLRLILTFYLCGCTKKRGYAIMGLALGIIGALATLINFVLLTVGRVNMQNGSFFIKDFILDRYVFIYLLGYWLLLLFLSLSASFLIYRSKSVVSVRRRVEL